jgi:uncharacterized membrane protein YbhN (UPF0104 family)
MNRKLAKNAITFIFSLFIFYLCYDLIKNLEYEKITKNFILEPNVYFKIILMCAIYEYININQNIKLYNCLQNNFSQSQFIFLYYSSSLSNHIMFLKLGTPIRFGLLKSYLGIKIRNSISVKMVLVSLSLSCTLVTGLVGIYFSGIIKDNIFSQIMVVLPILPFLIVIIFVFLNNYTFRTYSGNIWILKKIFHFGFDLTKRLKKFPTKVLGFVSIGMLIRSILLSFISFLIITQISNISISFFTVLAISAIGNLASLLSILPMGIGPKDLSLIYLFSSIGVEKELVLIMLLYDRIIWIFIPLIFGTISFFYLKFKELVLFKEP